MNKKIKFTALIALSFLMIGCGSEQKLEPEETNNLVSVPVCAKSLTEGQKITSNDVKYIEVKKEELSSLMIMNKDEVIGLCVAEGVSLEENGYFFALDLEECQ